jgi:hypothetical protein
MRTFTTIPREEVMNEVDQKTKWQNQHAPAADVYLPGEVAGED